MGHMIPVAEHMAMYHVETTHGTELIPENVCGDAYNAPDAGREVLQPYCEGSLYTRHFEVERKEGWYARLSAPGYLDCTDWQGPYASADEALDAVKEQYDVDDEGDDHSDDDEESEDDSAEA